MVFCSFFLYKLLSLSVINLCKFGHDCHTECFAVLMSVSSLGINEKRPCFRIQSASLLCDKEYLIIPYWGHNFSITKLLMHLSMQSFFLLYNATQLACTMLAVSRKSLVRKYFDNKNDNSMLCRIWGGKLAYYRNTSSLVNHNV